MRLLMLGPPGAGKGTQAKRLADRYGASHVASGDLLRAAVAQGTDLGRQASEYMDRGEYVPDELMISFILDHLADNEISDFILDGFPRTLAQAEALDAALAKNGLELEVVISLDVADAEIVERISGRRVCTGCGRTYHVSVDPPSSEGVCDACGAALEQRTDDKPETVKHRLEVYRQGTAPVVSHYRSSGLLVDVDGVGELEEVTKRIDEVVEEAIG